MKKMIFTAALAMSLTAFNAFGSGSFIVATDNAASAIYFKALADGYAHLASRFYVSFGETKYHFLYKAWDNARISKNKVYQAYLNAPVNSQTEKHALQAFQNANGLTNKLWRIYNQGGANWDQSSKAIDQSTWISNDLAGVTWYGSRRQ